DVAPRVDTHLYRSQSGGFLQEVPLGDQISGIAVPYGQWAPITEDGQRFLERFDSSALEGMLSNPEEQERVRMYSGHGRSGLFAATSSALRPSSAARVPAV